MTRRGVAWCALGGVIIAGLGLGSFVLWVIWEQSTTKSKAWPR